MSDSSYTDGRLEVRLLGPFSILRADQPIEDRQWTRRKAKAMFKLLALAPHHQLHREQLMEALWPELEPEQAANNLNKVIHAARRALEPELKTGTESRFIQTQDQQVQLRAPGELWIDVEQFEQRAAAALKAATVSALEAALVFYAGDLLEEDRYEDWAVARREQLRRLAQRLLRKLAQLHEAAGQLGPASEQWQQLLVFNPANEEAHRSLMRLYARSGSRHQALAQFQQCCEAVRKELDVEPEAATQTLYEQLLAGQIEAGAAPRSLQAGAAEIVTVTSSQPAAARSSLAADLTAELAAEAVPNLAVSLPAKAAHSGNEVAPISGLPAAPPLAVGLSRRKWLFLGGVTGLAVLLAAVAAWRFWSMRPPENVGELAALAVLPFTNSAGDAETDYLSDGLTESLINHLSRLPRLRVLARTTAFRFKGRELDPQLIGRDLHVQAILTGRVQQRGAELLIQADLIDVKDGAQLWGERYSGKPADLLILQRRIAQDITEKLRQRLTGEEQARVTQRPTANSTAYQLYLKGRYHWNRRTIPETQRAINYFNEALQLDPQFALAYSALADAWHTLSGLQQPPNEVIPRVRVMAQKALELDPNLAAAHASLGIVKWRYEWDYAGAEASFKRALALDPNYAPAHQWYGLLLAYQRQTEAALDELKQAQQLDPLSLIINANLGLPLYFAGRYDEAIDQLKRTLELDPNFAFAHFFLGWAYEQQRAYPQALAEFERAVQIDETPATLAYLGHGQAAAGQRAAALATYQRLQNMARQRYVSPYYLAVLAVGLGEQTQALDWLSKASEEHADSLVLLPVEPKFDPLRADPRFQTWLRQLGVPHK